jgi:hypothetical protein
MQVHQKRACASCGSENSPDASFCWRCLVPFAQVPPPPGVASGRSPGARVPPAPVSWSPPSQRPPKREGSPKIVRAIVSLVAAVVGYFGVQHLWTVRHRRELNLEPEASAGGSGGG